MRIGLRSAQMEPVGNISCLRKVVKSSETGNGSVMKAIQSAEFFISGREFTGLIRDCRNSRQWEKALEILEAIRQGDPSVGEPPSFYTFSATISVCSKSGRLEEAMWLLAEMKEAAKEDPSLKPDAAVYRLIVLCCARLGDCVAAVEMLKEMFHEGFIADEETLKRVLLVLIQGRSWKPATWLLDILHACGATLPADCYSDFIGFAVETGDDNVATEVFLAMQMAGVEPQPSTCHHIMHAILARNNLDDGIKLLENMHDSGIPVYTKTYACFLKASMEAGNVELGLRVAKLMEGCPG